jgi:hypothetical protein
MTRRSSKRGTDRGSIRCRLESSWAALRIDRRPPGLPLPARRRTGRIHLSGENSPAPMAKLYLMKNSVLWSWFSFSLRQSSLLGADPPRSVRAVRAVAGRVALLCTNIGRRRGQPVRTGRRLRTTMRAGMSRSCRDLTPSPRLSGRPTHLQSDPGRSPPLPGPVPSDTSRYHVQAQLLSRYVRGPRTRTWLSANTTRILLGSKRFRSILNGNSPWHHAKGES